VGKAAGLAGAGNVVGEGLAGALSMIAKSGPGAITRIRNKDAGRMLDAAPEVSEGLGRVGVELGNGTNSQRLQQLVTAGKQGLNDAKEEAVQRIEAALQQPRSTPLGPGLPEMQGPIGSPRATPWETPPITAAPGQRPASSGAPTPDTFWSRRSVEGPSPVGDAPRPNEFGQARRLEEANMPGPPRDESWRPTDLVGPRGVPLDIPSIGRPVSLREANAELTAIGEGLRHRDILDPTMRQREAGRAYAALSQEIRDALDAQQPGLGAAFENAQRAYAAGQDYLEKIANPGNWMPGAKPGQGVEFDPRYLQKDLAKNPLHVEGSKMGEREFDVFVNALTRGEGLGRVDKVPAGSGGAMDALMEWFRGAKTGTASAPLAALRSFAPNLGAQYIGRKPYSMDPGIKALIDLGILKATDAMQSGQPVKIGETYGR
jgi:hypothetical protein